MRYVFCCIQTLCRLELPTHASKNVSYCKMNLYCLFEFSTSSPSQQQPNGSYKVIKRIRCSICMFHTFSRYLNSWNYTDEIDSKNKKLLNIMKYTCILCVGRTLFFPWVGWAHNGEVNFIQEYIKKKSLKIFSKTD